MQGLPALLLLLCLLLLTACGTTDDTQNRQVFRFNLFAGLTSLDPALANNESSIRVAGQLYNGLVRLDTSLAILPDIAHRWEVLDSGRTYVFHLRPGVYFHRDAAFAALPDSTRPVRAQDFVYSLTRIVDGRTASPGAWVFNDRVAGVAAFREGRAPNVSGFAAPDDSTFVVRLTTPFPPFLSMLTMPYAYAVPREAVERYGPQFRRHPVGTGPFVFRRWDEGQRLVLLRNPHYYEPGLPKLDAVEIRFISSKLSAYAEFTHGGLDMLESLDPAVAADIIAPDGQLRPDLRQQFQLHSGPQLTTEYFGLMTADTIRPGHPLRDARVRRAISLAIDRQRLVRYLLRGQATPAVGFVPVPLSPFPNPTPPPAPPSGRGAGARLASPSGDEDAIPSLERSRASAPLPEGGVGGGVGLGGAGGAQAAKLLAEAGYPGGRGFPVLQLVSNPNYRHVSDYLQKSLSEIGIEVEVTEYEGSTLRQMIYGGQADFWRASWIADYPDAENFLALFYSANLAPGGPNTTRFSNPAYDRLYERALATPDDSLRRNIYRRMEEIILREAPVIPLFYYRTLRLVRPRVSGLRHSPSPLVLDLRYVQVGEEGR